MTEYRSRWPRLASAAENRPYVGGTREMATRTDRNQLRVMFSILNTAIVDQNFFVVRKLFKKVYSRCIVLGNIDASINLLHHGIIFMINMRQIIYAIDLSRIFAKSLSQYRITPNEEIFIYVKDIFKKFGQPLALARESMLNKVIKWTIKMCPEYPHGHPSLHTHIGFVYWSELNYSSAQYHYLRSLDGLEFAGMLVELQKTRGFKHEVDLFIAQVVLQGLCVRNKIIAESTLQSYTKLHPAINNEPPYTSPLLNFIYFLLQILDSGKMETFIILCEHYQSSLIRDPNFIKYLEKIRQLFFNEPIDLSKPRQT